MNRLLILTASLSLVACAEGPFELADAELKGPPEGDPCTAPVTETFFDEKGNAVTLKIAAVCDSDGNIERNFQSAASARFALNPQDRNGDGKNDRSVEFDPETDPAFVQYNALLANHQAFNVALPELDRLVNEQGSSNNQRVWTTISIATSGGAALTGVRQETCARDANNDPLLTDLKVTNADWGGAVPQGEYVTFEAYGIMTLGDPAYDTTAPQSTEADFGLKVKQVHDWDPNNPATNFKDWSLGSATQWSVLNINWQNYIVGQLGLGIGDPFTVCQASEEYTGGNNTGGLSDNVLWVDPNTQSDLYLTGTGVNRGYRWNNKARFASFDTDENTAWGLISWLRSDCNPAEDPAC